MCNTKNYKIIGFILAIVYLTIIITTIHVNKRISNDLINVATKLQQEIDTNRLKRFICDADPHTYAITIIGSKYTCPNRAEPLFYTISKKDNISITIDITNKIVASTILIILIFFSIIIFITVFNKIVKFIDLDIFKQLAEEKIVLVSSLQKSLTESLHHELMTPVSIIDIEWKDIKTKVNKLDNLCREGCDKEAYNRIADVIEKMNLYNESVERSIEKIFDILMLLAESKSIRYQNGNITINDLIVNAIKQVSLLSVLKPKIAIIDPTKILEKRSVSRTLTNGGFSSIITNLINNSIEAKATEIVFEVIDYDKTNVYLLYKDNGTGIRDCKGKLIKNTNIIFKYGYSNKTCNGHNRFKHWLIRTLGLIPPAKNRGFGMYITKSLLINAGGDIKVISSDVNGTEFKLTIPTNKS